MYEPSEMEIFWASNFRSRDQSTDIFRSSDLVYYE